ncbi:O-antigen ligase family protein [Egicoccus sp. AB-alg2]|uniref:O-antigen ligase family protein n=1 Tax=Egicoccus sp. AB-alg2 TaxID=3242693 RepID=UPI00359CDF3D
MSVRRRLLVTTAMILAVVVVVVAWPAGPDRDVDAPTPAPTAPPPDESDEPDEATTGLGRPQGFARATGGEGGPVRWVEHLDDGGPGSLRAAVEEPGPAHVRFRPGLTGLLTLEAPLLVASDLTIDGRGADVTIDNYGLVVDGATNVVIAYLQFDFAAHWDAYDGNAAIRVGDGSRDVWITHCTFVGAGPGRYHMALLFIDGAQRITASWNRFEEWDRTIMTAQSATDPELAADLVTLHHNLFLRTHQRNPLARFARVHTYNNWLYEFGWPGTGVGMVSDADAQLRSEGDLFESTQGRVAIKSGDWGSVAPPGLVNHEGSVFVGIDPSLVEQHRPADVFDPGDFYGYRVDPPDDALREILLERAGWQPTEVDTADDDTGVEGLLAPLAWAALLGGTFGLSRRLSSQRPALVPATVVTVGAVTFVAGVARGDLYDRLHGPLGYANATAALFVVAVAAALLWRERVGGRRQRGLLLAVGGLFATVPVGANSRTGTAATLLVLAAAVPACRRMDRRVAGRVVAAALLVVTAAIAVTLRAGGAIRSALGLEAATLGPSITERVRLWREAIDLVREAPWTGIGYGRFGAAGNPAVFDWERYAHNEYLHLAAELGLPVLALVLVLLTALYRDLLRAPDPSALLGVALLTALCVHAAVDYIAHFPLVALTAAASLGAVGLSSVPPEPERSAACAPSTTAR